MSQSDRLSAGLALLLLSFLQTASAQNRVTILNDAFGDRPELQQDWGYSALIEFDGKRILFDTGDNIEVFRKNVERMQVDLTHLDMVVITHAHGDHTSGLRYVLSKNPKVKLFVPDDPYFTGSVLPPAFFEYRRAARTAEEDALLRRKYTIGKERLGCLDRYGHDSSQGGDDDRSAHSPCLACLGEARIQRFTRDIPGAGYSGGAGRLRRVFASGD